MFIWYFIERIPLFSLLTTVRASYKFIQFGLEIVKFIVILSIPPFCGCIKRYLLLSVFYLIFIWFCASNRYLPFFLPALFQVEFIWFGDEINVFRVILPISLCCCVKWYSRDMLLKPLLLPFWSDIRMILCWNRYLPLV